MQVEVDYANDANTSDRGSPQCRICFDGPDQELGRLIRPCLCKGSISVSLAKTTINVTSHLPPLSLSARPCQVLAEVANHLRF